MTLSTGVIFLLLVVCVEYGRSFMVSRSSIQTTTKISSKLHSLTSLVTQNNQRRNERVTATYLTSTFMKPSNEIKTNSLNKKSVTQLHMAGDSTSSSSSSGFDASAWLNPNTRGGVIVWSIILITIPVGFYNFFVAQGLDSDKVGAYVGAIFVLLSNVLWASTYIFRVANKDMTYAKQLRDYENAVLQKRLEELADDEIDALMQEIEIEEKSQVPAKTSP